MDRDADLRDILGDLVDAIAQREAADPDAYDWTVDRRIRDLERELLRIHPRTPDEDDAAASPALAGIV